MNATLKIENNTTDQRIEWSSSNPDIVSVDKRGHIKVLADGETVITATTVVGGLSASVVINGGEGTETPAAATTTGTDQKKGSGVSDGKTEESRKPEEQTTGDASVFQIKEEGGKDQSDPETRAGVQNWRVYEMSKNAVALAKYQTGQPVGFSYRDPGRFVAWFRSGIKNHPLF